MDHTVGSVLVPVDYKSSVHLPPLQKRRGTMLVLVLSLGFLGSVGALTCKSNKTCSDGEKCYFANIEGKKILKDIPKEGCISSMVCNAAVKPFSLTTTNDYSEFANLTCCDSDNCTTSAVSAPSLSPGTLRCCGDATCKSMIKCNTAETICVQIQIGSLPLIHGCATDNICDTDFLSNSTCERVTAGAPTHLSIWGFHFLLIMIILTTF